MAIIRHATGAVERVITPEEIEAAWSRKHLCCVLADIDKQLKALWKAVKKQAPKKSGLDEALKKLELAKAEIDLRMQARAGGRRR